MRKIVKWGNMDMLIEMYVKVILLIDSWKILVKNIVIMYDVFINLY